MSRWRDARDRRARSEQEAKLERIAGRLGVSVRVLEQYLQSKDAEVHEPAREGPHRDRDARARRPEELPER